MKQSTCSWHLEGRPPCGNANQISLAMPTTMAPGTGRLRFARGHPATQGARRASRHESERDYGPRKTAPIAGSNQLIVRWQSLRISTPRRRIPAPTN